MHGYAEVIVLQCSNLWNIQSNGKGLVWVMGSPGGVKLNASLSTFLGTVFTQYVVWWKAVLAAAAPLCISLKSLIPLLSCFGLSGVNCTTVRRLVVVAPC